MTDQAGLRILRWKNEVALGWNHQHLVKRKIMANPDTACCDHAQGDVQGHGDGHVQGYFMQKLRLSFLYVIECLQKHAQKIKLTKQQKPPTTPHKNLNPSLRQGQHPLATFLSQDTNLVIPQSEKIENRCSRPPGLAKNNKW